VFRQSLYDFPCPVTLGRNTPSFGLHRFNEGLRFIPSDDERFSLRGDRQRLVYKGLRRSHRFTILGDTAFEYDCILEREPKSNVISLLMEGAEHFDFFRQPDFVKEPFLKGSYAVYKKETMWGEGTGKLCHIHRPEIIDARGRRCWGDLSVVGNELRITIPEKWLSEAKYPVVVDPTIGTSTLGSEITGQDPPFYFYDRPAIENQIALSRYYVDKKAVGKCVAYVYCCWERALGYIIPLVYTDNNNMPHLRRSRNEYDIFVKLDAYEYPHWRSGLFYLNDSLEAGTYIWFGVRAGIFSTRFDYVSDECNKIRYVYNTEPPAVIEAKDIYVKVRVRYSWYFAYDPAPTAQNYIRTLTQGVTLTDSRKFSFEYKRNAIQIAKANSSCSRFEAFYRNCVMSVHNLMKISRLPVFMRRITESIRLTMAHSESRSLTRRCFDDVNATTVIKRLLCICRGIKNSLMGMDTQSFSVLMIRSVPDKVAVTQRTSRWGSFFRGLMATAANTSGTSHKTDFCRTHADTVKAEDSVIRKLFICIKLISKAVVKDLIINRFLKAKQEMVIKSCVTREIVLDSRIGSNE
jgi:hypothetical protein